MSRQILTLRFAPWVRPFARLMGSLGGGERYQQAVVDFVREAGVRRVG